MGMEMAIGADFLTQLLNALLGQEGERKQNVIQQEAAANVVTNTQGIRDRAAGSGTYIQDIMGILGSGDLRPSYTAAPQIAPGFRSDIGGAQDVFASMGFGSPGQVIGAGRQGVYGAAGDAMSGIDAATGGLGFTPSFSDLNAQLGTVSTDLGAERTAAETSLVSGANRARAQAQSQVMQGRGRYSPEEMSDVAGYRGQQGAQQFQAQLPGLRGQFASAERGLQMQQRGQDMGLAQFAAQLKSGEMVNQAGIRAGGAQAIGQSLMGNLSNLALGESAENRLTGQTAITSRQQQVLEAEKIAAAQAGDWERVNMIEQLGKNDAANNLQALASLYGMDVNALLQSLGMETGALTGQDVFVPQFDTNLWQELMIADASKPKESSGSFGIGIPGVASYQSA